MSLTVRQHYRRCMERYHAVLDSVLPSQDPEHQRAVDECIADLTMLRDHAQRQSVFSSNEALEDMSTQGLMLFPVAYYLADLAGRRNVAVQHGDGSSQRARLEVLAVSGRYHQEFLEQCAAFGLTDEEEIERRTTFNAADRTWRVESAREQRELQDAIDKADKKMSFLRQREKRNRRVLAEEDEAQDEGGVDDTAGEETSRSVTVGHGRRGDDDDLDEAVEEHNEEEVRQRHTKFIRWALLEAFQCVQMNAREAEMLGSMTDDEKARAVATYQEALQAPAQRPIVSAHIPSVDTFLANRTVQGPPLQQPTGGANYQVLGCGHTGPLRQQIRDEAFQERNLPTMSLQEFADQEMAYVKEMQQKEIDHKLEALAEVERLGAEGVEERDRAKAADWDDWKDGNPANGLTAKGNYS